MTTSLMAATYVGPASKLRGKTALVMYASDSNKERVRAQFNDVRTGLGFGWHEFRAADFEIIEETPWETP